MLTERLIAQSIKEYNMHTDKTDSQRQTTENINKNKCYP